MNILAFFAHPDDETMLAGRPLTVREVILPVESLRRAYPPGEGEPGDPMMQMLTPYEARS